MLNVSYGISARDDSLPKRFFEPSESGSRAGKIPEPFHESIKELYKERGWDNQGKPLQEKIEALGLDK